MDNSASFGGTANTNYFWIKLDANGKLDGDASGVGFRLYYNGRLTSTGNLGGPADPAWFKW
jgi:hypothetical protein